MQHKYKTKHAPMTLINVLGATMFYLC
ncbi:hypothetical protein SAST44_00158 [Staphylococcus aureus]|nr:hypothetical protein SAST44_00158 [Staphylococcus aureus]QGQ76855.1 hypothetical protein SAST45_00159 [Staphylococcus aureus]